MVANLALLVMVTLLMMVSEEGFDITVACGEGVRGWANFVLVVIRVLKTTTILLMMAVMVMLSREWKDCFTSACGEGIGGWVVSIKISICDLHSILYGIISPCFPFGVGIAGATASIVLQPASKLSFLLLCYDVLCRVLPGSLPLTTPSYPLTPLCVVCRRLSLSSPSLSPSHCSDYPLLVIPGCFQTLGVGRALLISTSALSKAVL